MFRLPCLGLLVIIATSGLFSQEGRAQTALPLAELQRQELEQSTKELQQQLDQHPLRTTPAWKDTAIFAKGLAWALKYDQEFSVADRELLEQGIQRGKQRLAALTDQTPTWTSRRGKIALGYESRVDGSIQPYGVIVPKSYDPAKPIRLDVVLHGSSRPVGISELRFIARFDEGDAQQGSPTDEPYLELHPLGRVENCYRWSGETDVFEAIEDVCHRYNIDRERIVLRGMSMGASGTWHLGLKHPDRFVALGPYCGYVDTHKFSETPIPNFVKVGPLPAHQELGLHMLDSIDYAANAAVIPAIACMGEKDVFFQAHVLMDEAMQREGLKLINLISPGTGHVIDPVTQGEQLRRIAEIAAPGRRSPNRLRFVTWTLKYHRCHWLEVEGLQRHYARAELVARWQDNQLVIEEPLNITRFAIVKSKLPMIPRSLKVGDSEIRFPSPTEFTRDRVVIERQQSGWDIAAETDQPRPTAKRPGLQGPIDDAFTTPFLCVRGTGQPWNDRAQVYAEASLRRFAEEWHHYFRGELPIKDDVSVTKDDIETKNLILFGDPGSNRLIARVLKHLPLEWSRESLRLGGAAVSSAEHLPALIAPNPLTGNGGRYVVLNSGHTFREADLAKFNYLLYPHWGDWAVLKLDPAPATAGTTPLEDQVLRAGFYDENWADIQQP